MMTEIADFISLPRLDASLSVEGGCIATASAEELEPYSDYLEKLAPNLVIIDFLDERDYFGQITDIDTYLSSWAERFSLFHSFIKEKCSEDLQIVLVKNYLSLVRMNGNSAELFDNHEDLELMNDIINLLYEIVEKDYKDIAVIEGAPKQLRVSGTGNPWESNNICMSYFASKISDYIHSN